MTRIQKSIDINAPKEKIWSFVNWDKVPEYYNSIKRIQWTSEPKMRVGSTVRVFSEMAGRKEEFDTEITEWIPNEKVVWRTTSGNMPGEYTATLVPSSAGFKITTSFDYTMPFSVVGKLIDKLSFKKYMDNEATEALQRMKELAEK